MAFHLVSRAIYGYRLELSGTIEHAACKQEGDHDMEIFGYEDISEGQAPKLLRLAELTFSASTREELEAIASFLLDCAEKMQAPDWEHEHLGDSEFARSGLPEVIVFAKR